MASTLLAVDDSVTMRKVLEITFAGPEFRVVTANTPDAALQKLKGDKPDLVIADVSLDPMNGYDLCKAIKKAAPNTPVLLLSSKQNAFDAARGSAAQADDHMDKPFDTQQMIDKVKKLLAGQPAGAGAGAPVAAKPAAPVAAAPAAKESLTSTQTSMQAPAAAKPAAQPSLTATIPGTVGSPAGLPPAVTGPTAAAGAPPQRAKTLIYNPPTGGAPVAPAPARVPAGPTPVSGLPTQPRTVPAEPAAPVAAAAAAHVNGALASKLGEIGLTPAQVDAVVALSREVVERVVWEVVPVLAETIIKEEIARLTK